MRRRSNRIGPTQQLLIHDSRTGVTRQLEADTYSTGRNHVVGVWFMCFGNELVFALGSESGKLLALALHMYTDAQIGTNRVTRSLKELAEALSVTVPYVSKLLKALEEKQVCRKLQNGLYLMNPSYGWKGTAGQGERLKGEWNL